MGNIRRAVKAVAALFIVLLIAFIFFMVMGQNKEDLHPEWENFARGGDLFAVEPLDGFEVKENNDVLSLQGIYYMTWGKGEESEIVNDKDEKAKVYDCQIYLLAKECEVEEEAAEDIKAWKELEAENYSCEAGSLTAADGKQIEIMKLSPKAAESPFGEGISTFFTRDNLAFSLEIFNKNGYSEDLSAIMTEFLEKIHYAE